MRVRSFERASSANAIQTVSSFASCCKDVEAADRIATASAPSTPANMQKIHVGSINRNLGMGRSSAGAVVGAEVGARIGGGLRAGVGAGVGVWRYSIAFPFRPGT